MRASHFRFYRTVLAALALSACAAPKPPISDQGAFAPEKDRVVILVGVAGTDLVNRFNDGDGATHEIGKALKGVFAFSYPVGKTFKIKRVVLQSNKSGVDYRYADIGNSPSLTPDRPGIYYYATINTVGNTVAVNQRDQAELLFLAREKYKNVFQQLTPVNFK